MRGYLAGGKKAVPATLELSSEVVAEMSDLNCRLDAASHTSSAIYESSFRKLYSKETCVIFDREPAVFIHSI